MAEQIHHIYFASTRDFAYDHGAYQKILTGVFR